MIDFDYEIERDEGDEIRKYFPDKITDFSESSVGGMLLDMAAMVGDTMSFYLDQMYESVQ